MDTLTREERSERMSRVRAKNTGPERVVRRVLTAMGYRYRLQRGDLPGRPDIVLVGQRVAILVHGCFWHRHDCFNGRRLPKSRVAFWRAKLDGNARRDAKNRRLLRKLGWATLVLWECETTDTAAVEARIRRFLGRVAGGSAAGRIGTLHRAAVPVGR
ncbi:MAG: DNA mismatch endonuclease Vsr [Planctomycetes bacterium]|nr:DNA mismatch endonuclease Vsr [Planctomycetota bacterium]